MNVMKRLQEKPSVRSSLIVIGKAINKEILKELGFFNREADNCGYQRPDHRVPYRKGGGNSHSLQTTGFVRTSGDRGGYKKFSNLDDVLEEHGDVNIALISVDSRFVAFEAENTLKILRI